MSKLACHGHNFKKGAVGGMDRHNRRLGEEHSNKDIDTSRTPLNMTYRDTDNLYQECKAEVEKLKANGGRIRSDQNWLTEFCIYAPSAELSHEEYQRYFQEVYDFFRELVGDRNIKLAVVHMDEKTPHMHLDFMPLVRDERGRSVKLSSKEVVTRKFLRDIHDRLPDRLSEKGFDVQRGDEVKSEDKPLKGRSVKRYKADAEREKQELEKDIVNLRYSCQDLMSQILELDDEYTSKKRNLDDLEGKLREGLAHYQKLEKLENEAYMRLQTLSEHADVIEKGLKASYEVEELLEKMIPLAEILDDEYARSVIGKVKPEAKAMTSRISNAHSAIRNSRQSRRENTSRNHPER